MCFQIARMMFEKNSEKYGGIQRDLLRFNPGVQVRDICNTVFHPMQVDQVSTLWTAVGGVLVFLMVLAIGFLEAGLVRRRYAMGRIQVLELANAYVCLRNYFQLTAGGRCTQANGN
jgi:hypothetical protein